MQAEPDHLYKESQATEAPITVRGREARQRGPPGEGINPCTLAVENDSYSSGMGTGRGGFGALDLAVVKVMITVFPNFSPALEVKSG